MKLVDICDKKIQTENQDKLIFFESLISDKNLVVNTLGFTPNYTEFQVRVPRQNDQNISNFPEIDNFVQTLIGNGKIRSIKVFENKETSKPMIVYGIEGYKYCENVKREHKSNNVYFIADIVRQCVFSKCHDPECTGYRGNDIFLVK